MKEIEELVFTREVIKIPNRLPVVPVRDLVMFPYSVVPLLVGRKKSLAAIDAAQETANLIFVATQKNPEIESIQSKDIYRVGVICRILQNIEVPGAHSKIVLEGIARGRISRFSNSKKFFRAEINILEDDDDLTTFSPDVLKELTHYFKEYLDFTPDLPREMLDHLRQQTDPHRMVNFVALNIEAEVEEKQTILQIQPLNKRLKTLIRLLQKLIGQQRVKHQIEERVQENLIKNQRNYFLQEKLRVINKELGEDIEELSPEILKLEEDIRKAQMPQHAQEKAQEELSKLKKTPPFSPEHTVIRNYLDWMIRVPWHKHTTDQTDIRTAQRILDEDHFGLEKPKERIVDHLAVLQRVKKIKGPILCLVGPPGVGKTSLGKSVARALNRKFVRVSLGGVRDEAEIRGHRRTYIGSMPGKIIQSMKKAGTKNPVFLMDEIDKMSMDFRGDPASALLEVLDPEQNKNFNDHYLDIDYDLSEVFFITTANVRASIPLPLQDRMEIIELPGYLEHEKIQIARLHLIPKQLREHGLTDAELHIKEIALLRLIRDYTREAGVRNLEREIANLCRKATRELAENQRKKKVVVTGDNIEKYLGKPPYFSRKIELKNEIGMATGLAWTTFGGDILKIEVNIVPGKGKLILTGKLGEVMKESIQTGLGYIRSMIKKFDIPKEAFDKNDIHVHMPEGAIPKDGPSAGITITSAIISALTNRPVRNNIAMTGEITLRGKVLAVGGLNEKLLAAQRNNIPTVIVPRENEKDIEDLPAELRNGIDIIQVTDYREVLDKVLV
ncbi:MAG: endopeptidase La [Calditrichia bacterium]